MSIGTRWSVEKYIAVYHVSIDILNNKMIIYEYDVGGNIVNKKEYFYYSGTASSTPRKTINYTYGNTNWKDQLTAYNGKAITYDEIGNPLSYDGNTYTWQKGRQLIGISNNTNTITYKYSHEGIRTQKTVNGTTSIYYLEGSKVIYEQTGENTTYYTYDENGQIIGINYNNTQYYYIKNAQNDIVGILDSNLNQIVSYEYDSWGKVISIKDANGNNITSNTHIGKINPYRYRCYRYDEETGLYYLNSRYYNPEWGRFINADGIIGANKDILGGNLYVYGSNNPVNGYDPTGQWFIKAITSIINAAKQLCGFEYVKAKTDEYKRDLNSGFDDINAEYGSITSRYKKKQTSNKPIVGYVNNNNNKLSDSSIGVKINILKTSLKFNIGWNDISLNYEIKSKEVTYGNEFGISPREWGNIYYKVTSETSNDSLGELVYVKSSMSPLIPAMAYCEIRAGTFAAGSIFKAIKSRALI